MPITDARIRDTLLDLAHRRGADKTFCPSEAARALAQDWRPLMDDVRRVADGLEDIEAVQKGERVNARDAKGPIRLRLAQSG
ncbi:DUF3253 domain-containing protein [Oceaniglobus roseus]|uniref:DUF3253 domain-containing protein n=1 Tax=Oceaniglobus roseus TaxID=1737570 RepID=UPI001562A70D|nr:DUF3253 domain-containing protein [Kandeliimicrobium roseum]